MDRGGTIMDFTVSIVNTFQLSIKNFTIIVLAFCCLQSLPSEFQRFLLVFLVVVGEQSDKLCDIDHSLVGVFADRLSL